MKKHDHPVYLLYSINFEDYFFHCPRCAKKVKQCIWGGFHLKRKALDYAKKHGFEEILDESHIIPKLKPIM